MKIFRTKCLAVTFFLVSLQLNTISFTRRICIISFIDVLLEASAEKMKRNYNIYYSCATE